MTASNRMASFLATMKWEGRDKLSLVSGDSGNWTGGKVGIGKLMGSKFGVSAMVMARLGKTPATLTEDDALKLFVDGYFVPVGADLMAVGVDHCVSDDAYNAGPGAALGRWRRGGWTKASDPVAAIHAYSARRLSFLEALRSWKLFGRGWAARVAGVEAESLKMARAAGALLPQGLLAVSDHLTGQSDSAGQRATAARWRAGLATLAVVATPAATAHIGLATGVVMLAAAAGALHQYWSAHVQAARRAALGDAA